MTEVPDFPNEKEEKVIGSIEELLAFFQIKYTKQKSPRGLKIHCKDGDTRITFHIYNIADLK